jgi:hypothetical protein
MLDLEDLEIQIKSCPEMKSKARSQHLLNFGTGWGYIISQTPSYTTDFV